MTSPAVGCRLPRVFAVTASPVSAPAQVARAGRPTRRQAALTRQRISTTVLIIGTVLSLGSLVGPDWALRAGVVVALASAVVSCGLAWRELYLTKRRHAQDLLAAGRRHTDDLRAERRHNADVLDTVSRRAQRWRQEVDRQQNQIAGLRVEVSALRGDLMSVRRQLVRADGVLSGLRETVRDRDVELALMRSTASGVDAELHALPGGISRQPDPAGTGAGVSSGAPWTSLDQLAPEPALPNFEADRRSA